MKPYIQVIKKDGKTVFMHSENPEARCCDFLISGEKPEEFSVQISDKNNKEKEFTFSPNSIGRIIAHAIDTSTVGLVEALFSGDSRGLDLCSLLEEQELFFTEEGFDESLIPDFLDGMFKEEHSFFFRLTEEENNKWILSFVFADEEVKSMPKIWNDFSM
jgi:hypothetical protein